MVMDIIFLAWASAFVIFILLELSSPGMFYFLSLAFGAASSSIAQMLDVTLVNQFIIFAVTTIISFMILSYWVKKDKKDTLHESNIYALVGKHGIVIETLSFENKGWVKINGELWGAYATDNVTYEPNTHVIVITTSGSHLKVKKIEHKLKL